MTDLFQTVKQNVSMEAAAERYGLRVSRGKALCPFHHDTHPSLMVHKDFFYCFVCDTGGDVVSFVSKLLNLTPLEAAKQLAADFGLVQGGGTKNAYQIVKRRREQEKRGRVSQWEEQIFRALACAYRGITDTLRQHVGLYRTNDLNSALSRLSRTGYFLNILTFGSKEEKRELYQNHRKEVEALAYPGVSPTG